MTMADIVSFEPDNFGVLQPQYEPAADPADIALVENLFGSVVASRLDENVLHRMVLGSAASRKFRIESGKRRYFAKIRFGEQGRAILAHERAGARLLSGYGVPGTATPWDRIFSHGDAYGLLTDYIDGHYFEGHLPQFAPAIDAFVTIARALARGPAPRRADADGLDPRFLSALPGLIQAAVDRGLFAALPVGADETIRHELSDIDDAAESRDDVRPLHLDFHPQNLLYAQGKLVAVLDFEWLVPYPAAAGLGFAIYKLVRQGLSLGILPIEDARSVVTNWIEAWNAIGLGIAQDRISVRRGATLRVLFLIWKILDSSLNRDDPTFIADLPKQVRALSEIPRVFA